MALNRQMTDAEISAEAEAEANALIGKAVDASEIVDATIERDVAINAAVRASVNEAVAKEDAREQGADARSARAHSATLETLRRAANDRADREAQNAESSRFGLYFLITVLAAALLVAMIWLATRTPEIPSGGNVPGQSTQAPMIPPLAPPAAIPGPQGEQGAPGPSGTPGPSGPAGEPAPAAQDTPAAPSGQ